jgi:hypothetical protein
VAWVKQHVVDTEAYLAVSDVKQIRQIWREYYEGKWKCHRDDVSAEEIAGVHLGMTEDEVRAAVKACSR